MSRTRNLLVDIGDSISDYTGPLVGYGRLTKSLLGPQWAHVCWGVGGVPTATMLTNWSTSIRHKYTSAPKKVLTLFGGVNDALLASTGQSAAACTTALANLQTIVTQAVSDAEWDQVILMVPTPANGHFTSICSQSGVTDGTAKETNYFNILVQGIKALTIPGVTICDFNTPLLTDNVAFPQCLSCQSITGGTRPDFATFFGTNGKDFLHPNDTGHAVLAATLRAAIAVA